MKKLRNKKTGDIGFLICVVGPSPEKIKVVECIDGKRGSKCWYYDTITELNEEWEDAPEEPKEYWAIDIYSKGAEDFKNSNDDVDKFNKAIGNYFGTKEEAEKVIKKLKAWKRLKDKGFRFNGKEVFSEGLLEIDGVLPALERADNAERLKIIDDLDLLFGGEE